MESQELQPSGGATPANTTKSIIDWTPEQIQLLKDTVARGSTDDEFKLFLYVCSRSGLDPFLRQIHMVKRWDSTLKREVATIQTGIDGYRVIAERSGSYAGVDAPKFSFEPGNPYPVSATVTVYRMIGGQRVGFTATAFFDEYKQTTREGRLTRFWEKMPKSQLAKCAEALALRKAFPNDLSGLYTNEEMEQATEVISRPASEKQISYIEALLRNESVPENIRTDIQEWLDSEEKTMDVASTWIDTLQQYTGRQKNEAGFSQSVARRTDSDRDTDRRATDTRPGGSYDSFEGESDQGSQSTAADAQRTESSENYSLDMDQPTGPAEPPSQPRKRRGRGIATAVAKESREVREKPNRDAIMGYVEQLERQLREETDEGASMNFDKLRQMFAGNSDLSKCSMPGLMNYYQHLRERSSQRT